MSKFKGLRYTNLDAAENLFLERELEHKLAQSRDVKYAENEARKFIPVNNEGGAGTETIVVEVYDQVGSAKVISDYADDLPTVNAHKSETRHPVKSIGNSFVYSVNEIKAAAKAGTPLTSRHMMAAQRAMESQLDKLAALGDASYGIPGFLRRSDTLTYTVPSDGTGSAKTWVSKTPALIMRDVNGMVQKMLVDTNEVEKPDTLLLDPAAFAYIATTTLGATSDTTIADFIKAKSPWIKNIASWSRLSLAGGSSNTTRAVLYRRAPDALELFIPEEFSMEPPQATNLAFKVPCSMRTAGVGVHYPKSICYADGV